MKEMKSFDKLLTNEMSLVDKELSKFNNIKDVKNDKMILKNITKNV